jgi:hypothetical protein
VNSTSPPKGGRRWHYNGMVFTRLDARTWDWCGAIHLQRSLDLPRFWHAYFIGAPGKRLCGGHRRAIGALRALSMLCRTHEYTSVADWLDGKMQPAETNTTTERT